MFRNKKDLDKHVSDIFSKIHNENERNLRGYSFARMYYQLKDYETAKRYLVGFLSVRDHHAPSHKLMAQISEATKNLERALHSYKRSLEIDQNQKDIVLKICELYCQLPVDHETARYWADRADQLFPHHETVFNLRECLVNAEGEPNRHELENLITAELAARPRDVNLRIKLLKLFLDTERIQEAYSHALKVESKRPYFNSVDWYYCLVDVFEAYQEDTGHQLDSDFYIHFLAILDHLVSLTLAEPYALSNGGEKSSQHSCSIADAASVLYTFDQQLQEAWKRPIQHEGAWGYFLHHMKGQLYFRMATLLFKRAKKDHGNWKEACRCGAALFLISYTFKPSNLLQETWFMQLNENQKIFTDFFQQRNLCMSQSGHVIMSLCKEDKGKWLQKMKQDVCLPQVQERTYQRLFNNSNQKQTISTSHFLQDNSFLTTSLEFPVLTSLQEYNKVAHKLHPDSLHHLVWLSLHLYGDKGGKKIHNNYEFQIFDGLRFSSNVTTNGSPESLSQLDIEAFLHATVYTTFHSLEHRKAKVHPKAGDSPLSVPADIADQLCTTDQADWWRAAYGLYTNIFREKLGEQRRILQHGLEVIRGVGNHGLDVHLVVHLARTFANRATDLCGEQEDDCSEEVVKLKSRAAHYWSLAKKMLDKLLVGHVIKQPKDRLFQNYVNEPSSEEITSLQEEAQLFLACQAMNSGQLDTAATLLSTLSSAHASFYLALTLKRLAHQQIENYSQHDIPPHLWNNHIALLTKSQEALYSTMDRIRGDRSHPLNIELLAEIEDIDTMLAALNLKSGGPVECRDNGNDIDDEIVCEESPPLSRNSTPQRDKNIINSSQSTPHPLPNFLTPHSKNTNLNLNCKSGIKHMEPSPERLDAQVRILARSQDTLVRTLLEQQHTLVETNRAIVEALQQNKVVVEQLKKYLENIQDTINKGFNQHNHLKSESVKGQGDEDEEEYQDNCERNGCYLDYYVEDGNHNADFRDSYHYPQPHVVTEASGASTISYVPQPPPQPAPLNHYSYQYPPPPNLTQPPSATSITDRSRYFSSLGHGLPFSEGQQLPQFHFHVGIPHSKPPVFSRLGPSPHLTTAASTPPLALPPPPLLPPWAKSGVPHAFQIPLPPTAVPTSPLSQQPSVLSTPSPFIDVSTTTPTPAVHPQPVLSSMTQPTNATASQLKALLTTPSAAVQSSTVLPVVQSNVVSGTLTQNVSCEVVVDKKSVKNGIRCNSDINESVNSEAECHGDGDVLGDFTPVIPLPAEVAVRTGEEDEKVFFEERAKLFRFVGREWKERGIGTVKLLLNEVSNKVRLLMRRDQVLKVCANHYIVSNMELRPMKDSDRAFIWIAQDFADEEIKAEQFCIRFKTSDIAVNFKKAFDKAILLAKEFKHKVVKENEKVDINPDLSDKSAKSGSSIPFSGPSSEGFGSEFLPKPNTWNCSVCLVNNSSDKTVCIACESLKPGSHPHPKSMFTIQTSSAHSNEGTFGGKPLSSQPISAFTLSQSSSKITYSPGIVGGFGDKLVVTPSVSVLPCTSASTMHGFGPASQILNQLATQNQDKQLEKDATSSVRTVVGGFTFTTAPVIQENVSSEKPEREIIIVTSKAKEASHCSKPETGKSPFATFSFSLKTSNDKDQEKSTEIKEEPLFGMKSDISKLDFSSVSSTDCGFHKDSNFKGFAGAGTTVFSSQKEKHISKDSNLGIEAPEEFVPTIEFKPIVPLPELVELKTGEEEEEKIFGERSKLFRYDTEGKMWKERGVGELKILRHAKTGKCRLLMRREQVLKLCVNHYIHPDIKLTTLSSSDRAWVWLAQDYSEGELKQEKFAVKFKTIDIAEEFRKIFEKCQEGEISKVNTENSSLTNTLTTENQCSDYQKSLVEMFKLKPGQWECHTCYVFNKAEHNSCVACKTVRSPKQTQSSNTADSTFGNFNLAAQQENLSSKSEVSSQFSVISSSDDKANLFSTSTQSSNFKFGQSPSQLPGGHLFGFRPNVTTTNQTGLVFGNQPLTVSTSVTVSNSLFTNTTSSSLCSTQSVSVFGTNKFESPTQSSFSVGNNSMTGSLFKFGTSSDIANTGNESVTTVITDSSSPLGISDSVQFRFGSPQKFEFSFSGVRPRSPSKTPKSPSTPSDGDREGGDDEVESPEADIYFQPVIPLPPKVDLLTGEEDEDVLFSRRAKLFRFVDGEWKERGIGDIKILQHKKSKSVRLLMRRDQVLKVCLNHYISSEIKFCVKGEKSWMWTANDFSENESLPETFAIRFKTVDAAAEFKKVVDDGQEFVQSKSNKNEFEENPSESVSNAISPTNTSVASKFSFRLASESIKSPTSFSLSSRFGTAPAVKGSIFGNIASKSDQSSGDNQSSEDVIIIEEKKSSPEKRLLAESLLLPPNFFLYELKPPCTGCRGCVDLEEKDQTLDYRDNDDFEIIYEKRPTPEQVAKAANLMLPSTFFLYENLPPCKGCRGCRDDIPPYKDNHQEENIESVFHISSEDSFKEDKSENLFKLASLSFAELATNSTPFLSQVAANKPNIFEGAGTPVFLDSSLNKSKENEEDDNVAPAQDIHFEPVIPLPELVEIKTGEEDEIPVFCHRAKLYRYDSNSKQWKERGIGDFKILKHKEKCCFRLLMRRGQVHKVVCNHYLNASLELKPLSTSENTLCWTAVDYAEEQSTLETFGIKFKNKDTCQTFKEKLEECKNALVEFSDNSVQDNCDAAVIKEFTDSDSQNFHSGDVKSTNTSESFPYECNNVQTKISDTTDSRIEQDGHERDEDEDDDDDDDDDENIMFEKRVTLAVYDENNDSYKQLGIGTLRILYDDEVYGAHIKAHSDSDVLLCDHIIAVQTCLRVDEKNAFWAAMDISIEPADRRQFRATFSSRGAVEEFAKVFEEGKTFAVESEILEKTDNLPPATCRGIPSDPSDTLHSGKL